MSRKPLNDRIIGVPMDRVDGRLKVTGGATYSAEYTVPGLTFGVLVPSTIAKGNIGSLDTRKAEWAPGVLAVISHLNAPPVPGYQKAAAAPNAIPTYRIFNTDKIYFYGQPIALVVADTLERAVYAATLVKAQYKSEKPQTDFKAFMGQAEMTTQAKKNPSSPQGISIRGREDAWKTAPVSIEQEYVLPSEVHNPMELHGLIALWDGDDKIVVYDKTQGVKSTQHALAQAFGLSEDNVTVHSRFVGGAFGSALRTWPHEIAAVLAAKVVKRPVKLLLSRDQMFTMVGYRPHTWQKVALGATPDGQLVGITHEATGQTSTYEEFTENTLVMAQMMYACPNVTTRYKILHLDIGTPAPMRGPGESTGAFALECALDELSYALKMDPIELRLRNYAETDPSNNKPWSSKYLKEAYTLAKERFGWDKRNPEPRSMRAGEWLVGYGMASGTFGAHRGSATARARLGADGTLVIQSAASDIGPGTATAMTQIAADAMGISPDKIRFELGESSLPPAPTEGGSNLAASMGSAVVAACNQLRQQLALPPAQGSADTSALPSPPDYPALLRQMNLPYLEVTTESKGGAEQQQYSMYSFSLHLVEVHVHPATGEVRVKRVVACVDCGKVINHKTAGSQMIGGGVGSIGMALTEEVAIDHRFGRVVNNNLADYHVPVHADIPPIDVIFIDKPDPYLNPMGTKGLGEISLIGGAPAIANAVFHATGKRIRELPITPDKLI
jgi:xanthine dehydrogenase YagR molybdenum-binding subunit